MASADLENRFNYHRPDAARADRHQMIRDAAKLFGELLDTVLEDGREKSLALTKTEEAMFWANASIAREAT